MTFQGIRDGQALDANRAGLQSFLAQRGLTPVADESGLVDLVDSDGRRLEFEGQLTDLYVKPLDTAGVLSGGIFHAKLGVEEIDFIYEMCVAADWLVVNAQGGEDSPVFLVPNRNHAETELIGLLDEPSHMFVEDATEMRLALLGSYNRFTEWRDRVIGRS